MGKLHMEKFRTEQRTKTMEFYFGFSKFIILYLKRILLTLPCQKTLNLWFIGRFNVLANIAIGDLPQYGRSYTDFSHMNHEHVLSSVKQEHQFTNTPKMFQMSLHCILRDNLHLYLYKVQFIQKLQLTLTMLKLFSSISETG